MPTSTAHIHSGLYSLRLPPLPLLTLTNSILHFYFKRFIILFYVYECLACKYSCTPYVCSAQEGQERVSHPLELESQL